MLKTAHLRRWRAWALAAEEREYAFVAAGLDITPGPMSTLHWRHGCFLRNLWPTPSGLPAGDVIALAVVLA